MAVPTAPGYPQQSGIMIPEIWSGKLLAKFYAATVLAAISNTDYEGEIKNQGDTVWIRTTPNIQIKKYHKGQTLDVQRPEPDKTALKVDQANYWNTIIDDVDKFQSDIDYFSDWARDASEQMKIVVDREILGQAYADVAPENQGDTAGAESHDINLGKTGAPVTIGNGAGDVNPLQFLVYANQCMDEQNIPTSDRFFVLPSWLISRLKLSDIKNAALTGDTTSPVRNGLVGQIDGSVVYRSNLLAQVVDSSKRCTHVYAGQKSALTFGSQLLENKTMEAESTFGTLARGLHVYAHKVIQPTALVHGYVTPGS